MKKILVLCVVVFAGLAQNPTLWNFPHIYTGTANNWQSYNNSPNAIYIDVDFSGLGLVNVPTVIPHLSCSSHCWQTTGGSEVYNLTNTSFRIYVYGLEESNTRATPANANNYGFVLNYVILSQD